jgi:hypothetical protein
MQYALEQYGFMAKCVLNSWGVHRTSDFGNIVFNLIDIKQMKKTKHDRREDFDDVFDFDVEAAAPHPQTARLEPHVRRPGARQRVLFAVAVCALLAWLVLLTYMAFG